MWPYYLGLAFIIFSIIISIAAILFLNSRNRDIREGQTYKNAIVAGLLVLILFILILIDYLFIVNGREWVYTTNWMYHHDGFAKPKHYFQLPNRLNVRHILELFAMTFAGKIINYSNVWKCTSLKNCSIIKTDLKGDPDWIGIISNCIAISYPIIGLIISVFYVFGQLDPLYLFVNEYHLTTIKESYWFFWLRLFCFIIISQWILHSARTCILITVGMSVAFLRLLRNVKRANLQNPQSLEKIVRFYRKLSILLSLLSRLTNSIIGIFLGLAYFFIAGGICCLIFGIKEKDPKMILVFSNTTLGIICGLLFQFKMGDFLYCSSKFILNRWRNQCSKFQMATCKRQNFIVWDRQL